MEWFVWVSCTVHDQINAKNHTFTLQYESKYCWLKRVEQNRGEKEANKRDRESYFHLKLRHWFYSNCWQSSAIQTKWLCYFISIFPLLNSHQTSVFHPPFQEFTLWNSNKKEKCLFIVGSIRVTEKKRREHYGVLMEINRQIKQKWYDKKNGG